METSNPASRFPMTYDPNAIRPWFVPVLDLMRGRVVRAIGGRREEYQPLASSLTRSTDPREIAKVLILAAAPPIPWVYVADLDAILHRGSNLPVIGAIRETGSQLLCDGGFTCSDDARPYVEAGVRGLVIATETAGPAVIPDMLRTYPNLGLTLSIDLRAGELIGNWPAWGVAGPGAVLDVVRIAAGLGVEHFIVLDLARVGTRTGPGTEAVIAAIKDWRPELRVGAAGGVRGWDDITRLMAVDTDSILLSTALHDGTVTLPHPAT